MILVSIIQTGAIAFVGYLIVKPMVRRVRTELRDIELFDRRLLLDWDKEVE